MDFIQLSSPEQIESARALLREYETWLDMNLCFQNFEQELVALPGHYAAPEGRFLLAYEDGNLAGCVAMRPLDGNICEMKRLFLREAFRGKGLGRLLAEEIVTQAREAGYEAMRLDSLPGKMDHAINIYNALGFREIDPYCSSVPGAKFLEMTL